MSSSFRRAVERKAGPVLVMVAQLPKIAPFLVVLALLVAGLFAGGVVGFVLLGVLALGLGVLCYLAWPALDPPARVLRAAVALLVAVRAIAFLF